MVNTTFCRYIVFVLLAFAMLESSFAQSADREPRNAASRYSDQDRGYKVLTAVVARFYKDLERPVLIDEFLDPCPDSSHFQGDTTKLIDPLKLAKMNNDCLLGVRQAVDLKRFQSKHQLKLIKDGEYGTYFKDRDCELGWTDFYRRYPRSQGYARFSRVGFDESGELAYLQFIYVAGCLNGEGHLFIMRKVDEKWQLAADSMLWAM